MENVSSFSINFADPRRDLKFNIFRNVQFLFLPLLMLSFCQNPEKPPQHEMYNFYYRFTEAFNHSKVVLTLNNNILIDSTVTSILLAPNSGSSHWKAADGNMSFQKGNYKLHVEIENIEKDTTFDLNGLLFCYIAFERDSSKIQISIQNQPIIHR